MQGRILDIASKEPLRVLVVEDVDTDFLLTQRWLKKILVIDTLSRAANRAELVAALVSNWDLIVTDYHLPDIEERNLLAAIADAQPHTPCLVLSGSMLNFDHNDMPPNVSAVLEKGDFAAFSAVFAAT